MYKVGLEASITYHEVQFEIIDGYYYNESRNSTVNNVIKDLYDLRKNFNQEKYPAQIVIKLLMNSMCGKTIIKPVETYTIVKDNRDDFEKYISYRYNYIDAVIEDNSKLYIKRVKPILSHFDYVHCGVEILNMSKRIMDKIFSCADDCDVQVYYLDTDSIHLNYDDVPKTVDKYKDKYGSELVGNDLDNFHVDFDLYGDTSEIYAVESLFLGKKTYIDILESTDKDCKTINSEHIRLKGIPTPCIKYCAEQHNITVLDIYKKLCNNEVIKFDFTNDGNKCVCRNNKDHTISNVTDFTRRCQYIRDESDKFFIN